MEYRKSVTPGVPPASASKKRLDELRFCPLGRLVAQVSEIDAEIEEIRGTERPSRMAIASLMTVKFGVLKALLPYAYAKVPDSVNPDGGSSRVPITITLEGDEFTSEDRCLVTQINNTLDEVRLEYGGGGS